MKSEQKSDIWQQSRFNMVEIVIALVIILGALIGVLGLIPPSIESNTEAVSRSNAIDGADQFLHYMASRMETDWAVADAFPETKPDADESAVAWSNSSLINGSVQNSNLEVQIYYDTPDVNAEWSPDDHKTGLYRLVQTTENGSLKDFDGVVRVWKELFEVGPGGEYAELSNGPGNSGNNGNNSSGGNDVGGEGNGNTNLNRWRKNGKVVLAHYPPGHNGEKCITLSISENAVDAHLTNHEYDHLGFCSGDLDENGNPVMRAIVCVLTAEISWPSHVPYENRSKATYQLEVAKPALSLVDAQEVAVDDDETETEEPPEENDDTDPPFVIDDGQIILNEPQSTVIESLGCAITSGGNDCYVTTCFNIDGNQVNPFGDPNNPKKGNINDGGSHSYDAGVLEAGQTVDVIGNCYLPNKRFYMGVASSPANQNVLVLKDGDSVPDIDGMGDQADVEEYVKDYIDAETGTITLEPNQAILLFELGTKNMSSPAADFQDLVVLITLTPVE